MHTSKRQYIAMNCDLMVMLLLVLAPVAWAIDNGQVTVYRCTDSKGNVSIQDAACAPGSSQQISKMAKPKDSPTPKIISSPTSTVIQYNPSASAPVMLPRRPAPDLYQCTDFDGNTREAEFYDPRPRCVPLWVQGYQSPSNVCSWVEDSCLRYEGKALCDRWIAKQKQAVLNADRPSAENTDFKKAEAARLTQIVKDSCQ